MSCNTDAYHIIVFTIVCTICGQEVQLKISTDWAICWSLTNSRTLILSNLSQVIALASFEMLCTYTPRALYRKEFYPALLSFSQKNVVTKAR